MYPVRMAKRKVARVAGRKGTRQELLDAAAAADAREGIRQGLEDAKKGRGHPAREFFREFEKKHGLRRSIN
jgi:hypothetical protein